MCDSLVLGDAIFQVYKKNYFNRLLLFELFLNPSFKISAIVILFLQQHSEKQTFRVHVLYHACHCR